MLDAVALIVIAIVGWFVHQDGMSKGKREAKLEDNAVAEKKAEEVADATLEAKRASGIVSRLRGVRDRTRNRRAGSD